MPYAKAIAALLVTPILSVLSPLGVSGDMTLETALNVIITSGITALVVYFVPNRP